MKTEFECRLLDIDVNDFKDRLKKANATKIIDREMKRRVYDIPSDTLTVWARLRDNGKEVTLTVKERTKDTIDGTKEVEVIVSDFDDTNIILEKLGYVAHSYQENRRSSYKLNNVEIEIDTWPKIPTFVEFEGKSVKDIEEVVSLLGYSMKDTSTLNVKQIFKKYGIEIHDHKILKFD